MRGGDLDSSTAAKGLALFAAVAVHAAFGWVLLPGERVEIETTRGGEVARLGTFADYSAGTLRPAEASPTMPAESRAPSRSETVRRVAPDRASPAPREQLPAPQPPAEMHVPESPDGALPALAPPEVTDAAPRAEPGGNATPSRADTPVPSDRLRATDPTSGAVTRSLRPAKRNPGVAPRPDPEPRRAEPQAPAPAPRATRSGTESGRRDAEAQRHGTSRGVSDASGSAAASNYPGQVQAALARARKPDVPRRGVARVNLTISASGGIAALTLQQSSGSAAVDQAALRFVQGAAPFPAPPPGAQRTFTIPVRFSP